MYRREKKCIEYIYARGVLYLILKRNTQITLFKRVLWIKCSFLIFLGQDWNVLLSVESSFVCSCKLLSL